MPRKWIIGVCGSDWDSVMVYKFFGTDEEVKEKLMQMVIENREDRETEFEFGTESVDEIQNSRDGYYAYSCFADSHIDYNAVPFENISYA